MNILNLIFVIIQCINLIYGNVFGVNFCNPGFKTFFSVFLHNLPKFIMCFACIMIAGWNTEYMLAGNSCIFEIGTNLDGRFQSEF